MTRKDFELIARVIHNYPSHAASLRAARESFARAFADELGKTSATFDRARFLKACGVES
jgi:hypothetical protein